MLPPNALPGCSRIPLNPRSSAPSSIPGDTLLPINSSALSPRGLGSHPHHLICKTALLPPLAYRHWRSRYSISYSRIARAVSVGHIQPAPVCFSTIPLTGCYSISGNPLSALPHGYRSGLVRVLKSSFDISSQSMVRKCKP